MATVTNSNNRLTDADTTTGWASDGGGGAGPQLEPDLGYQLTSGTDYAISRKVGTTKGGHGYTHGSTVDMTAEANQVLMAKGVWYNSINAAPYPACGFKVGNSATVYKEYAVIDDGSQGDLDADPKRLTYIVPIDPNVVAWGDIISGTAPTLTTIDFFGIQGDFGGSAKAENVAMDAIDIVRGVGVLWVVGTAASFADFVLHDEGTVANRFGHISTVRPGVFEVFGKLWIGRTETPTATLTAFADSAKTFLFGAGFFDVGWTGIGIDLGNASTTVDFTDLTLKGQGQDNRKVYFDSITQIDPTPDEVTLVPAPGYITGTPVTYSKEGGTDTTGLTDATVYWLERVTDTTFNVHTSRDNARTGATPIALSDGSGGESHSFTRVPDTRPELEVIGTAGTFTATRTTFDAWAQLITTAASTFNSCIMRSCGLIDMTTNNGGSLQSCGLTGQTTEPGEALVKTNTTANIDDCDFALDAALGETGHAIEIDTAGSYALDGNSLTGYWVSPNNEKGATFHTQTGIEPTTDVVTTDGLHGFATGDEVFYEDGGLTDTIGLTDQARYYVDVLSTTTFTVHRSKAEAVAGGTPIALTDGSTGETQSFYSGNAAIVNPSGGAVTLTVGSGGTAPSIRNVGASTTTIILSPVTTTIVVSEPLSQGGGLLQNALVIVEARDGTGDLPFQDTVTITASGAVATVVHTAHGLNNGDKVSIRFAAEDPYNGVFAISSVTANGYSYTMTQGSPASPATIRTGAAAITSTGVVVYGLTNASGEISASRAFSVDQNVKGYARKMTSPPFYKDKPISAVVDSADGLTLPLTMVLDQS